MPLNTESERYTLLKEKITKQALSSVRNKEDVAFCSEDCFFVLFCFYCMKMQKSVNGKKWMVFG